MKKKRSKRPIIQLIMFIIAVGVTINHSLLESGKGISWLFSSGYIHYVCPICGVTTIYQFFASGADLITKLQNPVAIVLGLSVSVAIFFGPLFCGWICPFGAFQDFMAKVVGNRFIKEKREGFINRKFDSSMRWLRYVSLLVVIYFTAKSSVAVLESINPYHALLNLFIGEFAVIGLVILVLIALLSTFINRPWCKYLCPYGAFLGIFNIFRVKAIVREPSTCVGCKMCDKSCPMNIEVSKERVVRNHQCISCMECTSHRACPKGDTVKMKGTKGIVEKVKLSPVNVSAFAVAMVSLAVISASISFGQTETTSFAGGSANVTAELEGDYSSGTYTGQGTGFNTGLMVEITIDDNQIVDLEITDHNETIGYYETAFEEVPSSIISYQSTDVDGVAGATRSSEGIIEAVNDALEKAETSDGIQETALESEDTKEVEDIDFVKEAEAAEKTETVEKTEVEDQDSRVVEASVIEKNETVESSYEYIDGSYTGSATGYKSQVTVEVTVENSAITSVEVIEEDETIKFMNKALAVIDDIISTQSTEVDGVAGATYSSNAIISGTEEALADAMQ